VPEWARAAEQVRDSAQGRRRLVLCDVKSDVKSKGRFAIAPSAAPNAAKPRQSSPTMFIRVTCPQVREERVATDGPFVSARSVRNR